jgi:hypothetical protein
MIPHIVIFYKQFDQPLAKQTKTVKLSIRFSPVPWAFQAPFCTGSALDFLPQLRYTMERASRAHIQIIRRSAAGRLFLTYSL